MSWMFKDPMWLPHECPDETLRGDRAGDPTVVILKAMREPDKGFPNKGQFMITLKSGAQGFFINKCPFCAEELRFKE
jgi:hypothetical protein